MKWGEETWGATGMQASSEGVREEVEDRPR